MFSYYLQSHVIIYVQLSLHNKNTASPNLKFVSSTVSHNTSLPHRPTKPRHSLRGGGRQGATRILTTTVNSGNQSSSNSKARQIKTLHPLFSPSGRPPTFRFNGNGTQIACTCVRKLCSFFICKTKCSRLTYYILGKFLVTYSIVTLVPE